MILPKKHISVEESMFGFGAYLLQHIAEKTTVDKLWDIYLKEYQDSMYGTKFSFDQFIVTIDYLFAIGAIETNEKGELIYAIN
ncbi:MAG: hypothetical protein J1E34_04460 [Oscillospiraceae bacterium]|nr:hypothetical protein [Oscillospiraceae bacterium]